MVKESTLAHCDVGDPVEQAVFYDAAGADEIVFLDIAASKEGRGHYQERPGDCSSHQHTSYSGRRELAVLKT